MVFYLFTLCLPCKNLPNQVYFLGGWQGKCYVSMVTERMWAAFNNGYAISISNLQFLAIYYISASSDNHHQPFYFITFLFLSPTFIADCLTDTTQAITSTIHCGSITTRSRNAAFLKCCNAPSSWRNTTAWLSWKNIHIVLQMDVMDCYLMFKKVISTHSYLSYLTHLRSQST